jgi:hypothetical protein
MALNENVVYVITTANKPPYFHNYVNKYIYHNYEIMNGYMPNKGISWKKQFLIFSFLKQQVLLIGEQITEIMLRYVH